jgi:Fur family transcriptional regulator, ferric uptake regulator
MNRISNSISINKRDSFKSDRKTLKDTGLRATNQRALVLDIILKGGGHLDADEVYRQARKKQPQISLSTIYRALRSFKKHNLVEEIHFDEEHHHYEAKSGSEHHHLICSGCGKVTEFQYPLSQFIRENIPEVKGHEITGTEVRMTGLCPKCRLLK